jgi:hypothetical protein
LATESSSQEFVVLSLQPEAQLSVQRLPERSCDQSDGFASGVAQMLERLPSQLLAQPSAPEVGTDEYVADPAHLAMLNGDRGANWLASLVPRNYSLTAGLV